MGVGGFHCCTNNYLKSTVFFSDEPPEPETSRINKLKVSSIVYPTEIKNNVFKSDPQKIISNGIYNDDDEFDKKFNQLEQNPIKESCNN